MFFTLLNSAMCLNSWCTLEAMFRFLTFPPFCYVKIRKKDDFASILNAWFYFVFAKKLDILVRKYVYFRALGNAELRVLVRTFFPWDACFSLVGSSAYACFFSRHTLKNPVADR